jgi:hypothetical protein
MHDKDFEEILADAAEKEPGIVRTELKRIYGVAQHGVDVEGFRTTRSPFWVISCKCYKRIRPSDVDDFLEHFGGHWKDKGVKRFVLSVSVELNDVRIDNIGVIAKALKVDAVSLLARTPK